MRCLNATNISNPLLVISGPFIHAAAHALGEASPLVLSVSTVNDLACGSCIRAKVHRAAVAVQVQMRASLRSNATVVKFVLMKRVLQRQPRALSHNSPACYFMTYDSSPSTLSLAQGKERALRCS